LPKIRKKMQKRYSKNENVWFFLFIF
jgi:hypothetical protein